VHRSRGRCLLETYPTATRSFSLDLKVHMKYPDTLDALWSDLLEDEPAATQALLAMSKRSTEVTEFLEARLVPLNLAREELLKYVGKLDSNNEDEWREAVKTLEYFDPRLAMGLEELLSLKAVQTYPARHRLVDVLSDRPIDAPYSATTLGFRFVTLCELGDQGNQFREGDRGFNFRGGDDENSCRSSWWAEHRIDRLNARFGSPKREWIRIVRALALLHSFGTSAAHSIIVNMASGHPDSQPTKIALTYQACF
jgi:hypothetical protein